MLPDKNETTQPLTGPGAEVPANTATPATSPSVQKDEAESYTDYNGNSDKNAPDRSN